MGGTGHDRRANSVRPPVDLPVTLPGSVPFSCARSLKARSLKARSLKARSLKARSLKRSRPAAVV
jgi:hypothetical protein